MPRFLRIKFHFPQFFIQAFQQPRQIAVSQRVAQSKGARRFIARANRGNVIKFDGSPSADKQRQFFGFIFQLPGIGANAGDKFGQRFFGDFLSACRTARAGDGFSAFRPIPVIRRKRFKIFDRCRFFRGF